MEKKELGTSFIIGGIVSFCFNGDTQVLLAFIIIGLFLRSI